MAIRWNSPYDYGQVRWLGLLPTVAVPILALVLYSAIKDSKSATSAHVSYLPPADARPLKLRATANGQQVEVFWDHNSSSIREAEKATIRISDGDITEAVPFDSKQLQDGSLIYRPHTNDVTVRMEVSERNGGQVSESVRAVAMP